MTQSILREIDFEMINELIIHSLGMNVEVSICDVNYEIISSASHSEDQLSKAIKEMLKKGKLECDSTKVIHTQIDSKSLLSCLSLVSDVNGVFGHLVILAINMPELDIGMVDQTLKIASSLIKAQYRQLEELNDMAKELTERYEELNLVYSMDEHINNYDVMEGYESLKQIVTDCMNFLLVDGVMLSLPDDNIIEVKTNPEYGKTSKESARHWISVRKDLMFRLKILHDSLVINDTDDPERKHIGLAEDEKMIGVPVTDMHSGITGMLAVFSSSQRADFTNSDRKLMEVLARQISLIVQSGHDMLTGLHNRLGLDAKMAELQKGRSEFQGTDILLLLDIDNFGTINDTCGKTSGDELIKQVASTILNKTRESDTVARIAGDEFIVILENCPSSNAKIVSKQLLTAINLLRFTWENKVFDITACIGIISLNEEVPTLDDAIGMAYTACQVAKSQGYGQVYEYQKNDPKMLDFKGRTEWLPRIKKALSDDDFILYSQPISSISGDDPVPHFEVLVRLKGDDGKLISPFVFIGPAEHYNLMPSLDRWIIEHTLKLLGDLPDGYFDKGLFCSINLSGQTFSDEGLFEFVLQQTQRYGIPAEWICFEVTETAAISKFSEALHLINRFKEVGFRFALDDFGSGLSSFSYLNTLPVDYLKIDGSFVKDIDVNEIHAVMVDAINKVGHAMGLKTIAEFIENQGVLERLKEMDVDYAQGYFFRQPLPLKELLTEYKPGHKSQKVAIL